MFEKSIKEITKLRRRRFDEIAKKEKKISSEYFGYSSPSDMYKTFNETESLEENKTQVNTIENKLTDLMETLKSSPTSDAKNIKNRNNLLGLFELILYFNQLNQARKG